MLVISDRLIWLVKPLEGQWRVKERLKILSPKCEQKLSKVLGGNHPETCFARRVVGRRNLSGRAVQEQPRSASSNGSFAEALAMINSNN